MTISATIQSMHPPHARVGHGTHQLHGVVGVSILAVALLPLLAAAPAGSIQQAIATTVERAGSVAAEVPKWPAQLREAAELTMAAIHHYG